MVIHEDTLWGTSPAVETDVSQNAASSPSALPASAVPTPVPSATSSDSGSAFLSPDQIQHIISEAVRQSLAAQFRPPSRAVLVTSGYSAFRSVSCQNETLVMEAPASPVATAASQAS